MQILRIGCGLTELSSADVIGEKAANLAHMAALGLQVPPAFVLPVSLCTAVINGDANIRQELSDGLREGLAFLEKVTGSKFGDHRDPLLVSVRSGAARSMPGMLDTVLDVGCTQTAVHGLVRISGHPRFAWDCRRRFLESYARVVLGLEPALFTDRLAALVAAEGIAREHLLDGEALERLAAQYQQICDDADNPLSENPFEQLEAAVRAVYRSWMSPRACTYRRLQHLNDLQGTAVTVQAMVFGNRNLKSAAGVAFSRDSSTGAARPVIEVMFGAQGEDVVSGDRTPDSETAIDQSLPVVAAQLRAILPLLERKFGDVPDVEFTIEDGKLWILQTRAAKRTPLAALRFAVDLVHEGLITPPEALKRLRDVDLDKLARKRLVSPADPAARGTGASAGVAVGRAVFDSGSATRLAVGGDPIILVRPDTSAADVAGFAVSAGIVTAVGGRTAHAALVARQMGKPCVVGCSGLRLDIGGHRAKFESGAINEGDWLSIDGESGAIYLGRCDLVVERPDAELEEIKRWRGSRSPEPLGMPGAPLRPP